MITDGLRLANETSQRWQEKHNQPNDQQEQPANVLNSRNHQFDNHSKYHIWITILMKPCNYHIINYLSTIVTVNVVPMIQVL